MRIPIGHLSPSPEEAITVQDIRRMVETFYGRVQSHSILGPYFAQYIEQDAWPEHLDRMTRFWSSTLLASREYYGNPLQVHAVLPDLRRGHFPIWLALFQEVLSEIFPLQTAMQIMDKAERMGRRLQTVAQP